jgi:tetratricopeptide (TPR) repeat protein
MVRHLPRILSALVVVVLVASIWHYNQVIDEDGNKPLGVLFVLFILLAFTVGFVVISYALPWFGDKLGEVIYHGEGEVAEDPKAPAHALVAQGDYEGAIALLRDLAKKLPDDRTVVVEIAKLYKENLNLPEAAISTYEQALASPDSEWDDEDRAFFMFRLVEFYAGTKGDYEHAKHLLQTVIERFPGSRHSANATHKLREVEEAEFAAAQRNH